MLDTLRTRIVALLLLTLFAGAIVVITGSLLIGQGEGNNTSMPYEYIIGGVRYESRCPVRFQAQGQVIGTTKEGWRIEWAGEILQFRTPKTQPDWYEKECLRGKDY